MTMQDDPWSALQKPGSEAVDEQQARIAPAYATINDRGLSVVGFDLAMPLPALCVKCGGTSDTTVVMSVQVKMDFATALVTAPDGAEFDDKIGPGEYPLRLPYCQPCERRRQRAIKLRWARIASPMVFLAALVAAAVLHDGLFGAVVLTGFSWAG